MFSIVLIVFAACVVRSQETSSYYVVRIPENATGQPDKQLKVYWNVPTMQCKSKRVLFGNLYRDYGIVQNRNDSFRGESISILYDPGIFPALLMDGGTGKYVSRNGGVPQEGDLERHLAAFKRELDESIPDRNFSGVGIIDFESWRPVYRQNFGVLAPYKDVSYQIEKNRHWWWLRPWLIDEATRRFEEAGQLFMQSTLELAKTVRPQAKWGYYAYPYCFNMAGKHLFEHCANNVPQENERIPWLWSESTALYPSLYSSKELSTNQLQLLIRGRMREAGRLVKNDAPILPYFWFRYRDGGFMSEKDLKVVLDTLYNSKASGFIIWGSSNDVNTKTKCLELSDYVNTVLGPMIAKYTKRLNKVDEHIHKDDVLFNTTDDTVQSTTNFILDPEIHWIPPENYTQNIISYVQSEFGSKINNTKDENINNDTKINNNKEEVIIDKVVDFIFKNGSDNHKEENVTVEINNSNNEVTETYVNTVDQFSTNPQNDILNYSTISTNTVTNGATESLVITSTEESSRIEEDESGTTTTEVVTEKTVYNNNRKELSKNNKDFESEDIFTITTQSVTIVETTSDNYDTQSSEIREVKVSTSNTTEQYMMTPFVNYTNTTDPITIQTTEPNYKFEETKVRHSKNIRKGLAIQRKKSETVNAYKNKENSITSTEIPQPNEELITTDTPTTREVNLNTKTNHKTHHKHSKNNKKGRTSNKSSMKHENDILENLKDFERDLNVMESKIVNVEISPVNSDLENNESRRKRKETNIIKVENDSQNDNELLTPMALNPATVQVSGSSADFSSHKFFICIMYFYSIGKCLCIVFNHCL